MTAGGGDWVSKIGADALQTIGRARDRNQDCRRGVQGVACGDGVLKQLGLLNDAQRQQLDQFRQPLLKNAGGTTVGDVLAVFTLRQVV